MTACAAVIALLSFAVPQLTQAQELRGLVLLADGQGPAAGVVAVLMHGTIKDSIVARTITNDRGRFSLTAPANVTTRLRLLRIGFEPMDGGSYTMVPGEIHDETFSLHNTRIQLAEFRVKEDSRCQVQPTGAQLVAQLFQQAQTALIASTSSLTGVATARSLNFERRQDRRAQLLRPVDRTVRFDRTLKPYTSLGADSLDVVGYIVPDGTEKTYYAPDAEVLLSDKFLSKHCLQLVSGRDSLAGSIGIGFRPTATRKNYVDVQGTLWLDRETSELQFLEFVYTPIDDLLRREALGGRVDYAKLPNGGWFVSTWNLRMPLLTEIPEIQTSRGSFMPPRIVVSGTQIAGGAVQEIRLDNQLLYVNSGAERVGSRDGDKQFEVSYAPPAAMVHIDSDSGTAKTFCANEMSLDHEGLISGRVFDERGKTYTGALVKAEWREGFQVSSATIRWDTRSVATTSSTSGSYLLCGIAVERNISVFAARGERREDRRGRATLLRVTEAAPVTLDLVLPPPASNDKDLPQRDRK